MVLLGVGARGFSYLGLLFFVAITAAALAALGQAWSTAAERERERELEFRGNEIARAIQSYAAVQSADPGQPPQYPASIDDLLNDRRGVKARHHLRRAYVDPFTGKADWMLVPDSFNPKRFSGVHSRSTQVLLREVIDDGTPVHLASDWVFNARPPGGVDPGVSPASSPSDGAATPKK